MKIFKSIAIIATMLLVAACSSSDELGAGKTGKAITVSGYTYDQVWHAAITAIKQEKGDQSLEVEKNLTVSKEDKNAGVINASTGMSMLSWGEVVGVFISPAHNAPSHRIEVESLSKMKTNVFANNWEDELLRSIQKNLSDAK